MIILCLCIDRESVNFALRSIGDKDIVLFLDIIASHQRCYKPDELPINLARILQYCWYNRVRIDCTP